MIQFGGIYYYLDLEAFEKLVYIEPKKNDYHISEEKTVKTLSEGKIEETLVIAKVPKAREIDSVKYDILRNCIVIILDSEDQGDSELGPENALEKMPMAYKVAFNTLYKYEIIKEQE